MIDSMTTQPEGRYRMKTIVLLWLASLAASASAEEKHEQEGPCKAVKEACEKAGFVKGQAKEGTGLWVDCIEPIMKGSAQPAEAKKPLPKVSADLVNACKAKHPDFGQGKEAKK